MNQVLFFHYPEAHQIVALMLPTDQMTTYDSAVADRVANAFLVPPNFVYVADQATLCWKGKGRSKLCNPFAAGFRCEAWKHNRPKNPYRMTSYQLRSSYVN